MSTGERVDARLLDTQIPVRDYLGRFRNEYATKAIILRMCYSKGWRRQ